MAYERGRCVLVSKSLVVVVTELLTLCANGSVLICFILFMYHKISTIVIIIVKMNFVI